MTASSGEIIDPSVQATFPELGVSKTTLQALARIQYENPTPVQAGMIPDALLGKDIMAQARTGTGKTAAFAIPILERLGTCHQTSGLRALILTPTRELAVQVNDEIQKLAYGHRVRSVPIYGGKPIRLQIERLRRGADILVGTPGRILDHLGRRTFDLNHLITVVLDEADRMLDIGFRPDIEKILRHCPKNRQTLLLSATVPPPVEGLARRYMKDPLVMDFSPRIASETIEQYYFTVDKERKFELLLRLLEREQPRQAIVFCRTRRGTDRIYRRLAKRMPGVDGIHGDMQQRVRDRVMKRFRAGDVRILIATDVVGRGIDVSGISHIINYDIPESCDDYIHRVGRTGRMGREGVAYTFVAPEEGNELTRIEMRVDRLLVRAEMENFESFIRSAPSGGDPSNLGIGVIEQFGYEHGSRSSVPSRRLSKAPPRPAPPPPPP
ncbi:MAG: DEAD/DEAH box helicase, partial [Pirellulales bacterium]|nr:DEAD/DEAH box helicase [Pirellulales bacterium]